MYNIFYDSLNEYSISFENNENWVSPNYGLYNFNINMIRTYEEDNLGLLNNVNNVPYNSLIDKPELEKNNIAQDTKNTSTKKKKVS